MSPCDKHLFQQAVTDVTPLRPSKKHVSRPTHTPRIHKSKPHRYTDEAYATHTNTKHSNHPTHTLSHPWETSHIHAETSLSYGEHHLQRQQFRDLKQGKIRCEAQLDLHGFRIEPAADALVQFITRTHRQNQRCVRVIHGKGGRYGEAPVLKTHVNHWLKQLPEVLAFHSACSRDGGSGALYVLLKRNF
ncbi:MAG: Smr/MutS family protein [Legionellaceae bacterium]|nr:Smr/MutS family protein [Legionellaceae bacterium]